MYTCYNNSTKQTELKMGFIKTGWGMNEFANIIHIAKELNMKYNSEIETAITTNAFSTSPSNCDLILATIQNRNFSTRFKNEVSRRLATSKNIQIWEDEEKAYQKARQARKEARRQRRLNNN